MLLLSILGFDSKASSKALITAVLREIQISQVVECASTVRKTYEDQSSFYFNIFTSLNI